MQIEPGKTRVYDYEDGTEGLVSSDNVDGWYRIQWNGAGTSRHTAEMVEAMARAFQDRERLARLETIAVYAKDLAAADILTTKRDDWPGNCCRDCRRDREHTPNCRVGKLLAALKEAGIA